MKAKRSLAVALATMAVIGCMAAPSMAKISVSSGVGVNGRYNGSMLEYQGWGTFKTDSKGGGYGYVGLNWNGKYNSCNCTWVQASTNCKICYSYRASSNSGGTPTAWASVT